MHLTKITSATLCTATLAALAMGCGGKSKPDSNRGNTTTTATMPSGSTFTPPPNINMGNLPGLITAVTPNRGSIYGGDAVKLTGNSLFLAGATVFFDGLPANNVVVTSSREINCVTPPHAAGQVTVEVRLPNGNKGQLVNGFLYDASLGPPARVADYGDPSGAEQELVELINRARKDPAAEGRRLNLDFSKYPAKPPLSHNQFLAKAALDHTQDMAARAFFDHPNPDGVNANGRLLDSGYMLNDSFGTSRTVNMSESIAGATAGSFRTPQAVHDALMIDAGLPSPKHREIILGFGGNWGRNRETGQAFRLDLQSTGQLKNLFTQEFAYSKTDKPFIVGTVFDDRNGDGIAQIGEGKYNQQITLKHVASGFTLTTNSKAAGGYAFEVFVPGDFEVDIAGQKQIVTMGNDNVKVDLRGNTIALQR